ncbi:MAG: TRAP transporter small permease [Oscillospiraceae bacterium]|nr:TRAP transporter small permease [Oscillospiraceae bacterium]
MKYPAFMRKINRALANVSGILLIVISVLSVFEAIMRGVFNHPTKWSLDLTCYLLLWAIFLGTAYAYQEKGHVAVDLVRDAVEKRWGKKPRRVLSVIGYLMVLATVLALFYAGYKLMGSAMAYGKLTQAMFQIPIAYLYAGIIVGSLVTVVTSVFIIIDLCSGGDTYL